MNVFMEKQEKYQYFFSWKKNALYVAMARSMNYDMSGRLHLKYNSKYRW